MPDQITSAGPLPKDAIATEIDLGRPIGISPHFSVHATGKRQVLLLSEERSFRLGGRLYVALLPYLDGKRTGQDVVKAFDGRVPAERMRSVLQDMLKKNYICYLDAAAPAARQAMWVELGLPPADAERDLAGHAVAVVPVSRNPVVIQSTKALRLALTQAGVQVAARKDADLLVVVVEDYLRRDLATMNRRMRKAGRTWMLFKAGGSMPLLGPLFRPHGAPCWACLSNHMMENRPGDTVVRAEAAVIRPARAYTPASLSFAATFAALELARALADEKSSTLESHVLSFDLPRRAYGQHMVRLTPNCPVCGAKERPKETLERAKKPLVLQAHPVLGQVDGGWRTLPADEVVYCKAKGKEQSDYEVGGSEFEKRCARR